MYKAKLIINGKEFPAVLKDNETVSQLIWEHFPLEMEMKELNNNEKYYYLPQELRFDKEIKDLHAGDIKLYGDDCIVLFYRDSNSHYKYTDIGEITNTFGLEEALGEGDVTVQFMLE